MVAFTCRLFLFSKSPLPFLYLARVVPQYLQYTYFPQTELHKSIMGTYLILLSLENW